MSIDQMQRNQLDAALRDAFRRKADLTRMVRNRLGENLEEIAGEGNLKDQVFSLLEWATSHDKIEEVLTGAIEEVPSNPKLLGCRDQISNSWKWKNYIEGLAENLFDKDGHVYGSLKSHLSLNGSCLGSSAIRPIDDLFDAFLADGSCRLLVLRGKAGSGKSALLKKWQLKQLRNVRQIYENYDEARKTDSPTELPDVPTIFVPVLAEVRSRPDKLAIEDFLAVSFANTLALTQMVDLSNPNSMYKFIHQSGLKLLVLLDALDEIQLLDQNSITKRIDIIKNAISTTLSIKWIISVRIDEESLIPQLTDVLQSNYYQIIDLCDLELDHVASYVRANLPKSQTEEDSENHGKLLTDFLMQSPLNRLIRVPMWLVEATNYLVTKWLVDTNIALTNLPLVKYLEFCINKVIIREIDKYNLSRNVIQEIILGLSNLAHDMESMNKDYCMSIEVGEILANHSNYGVIPFHTGIMIKGADEQRAFFSEIHLQFFFCAKFMFTTLGRSHNNRNPSSIIEKLFVTQETATRSGWIWAFLLDMLNSAEYSDVLLRVGETLFQAQHLDTVYECFLHSPAYIWDDPRSREDLLRVLRESAAINTPETVAIWLRLIQSTKDEELVADLFVAAYESHVQGLAEEAMERLTSLSFLLADQPDQSDTRISLLQAVLNYLKYDTSTNIQQLSDLFDVRWPQILDAVSVAAPNQCLPILDFVQSWVGPWSHHATVLLEKLRTRYNIPIEEIMQNLLDIIRNAPPRKSIAILNLAQNWTKAWSSQFTVLLEVLYARGDIDIEWVRQNILDAVSHAPLKDGFVIINLAQNWAGTESSLVAELVKISHVPDTSVEGSTQQLATLLEKRSVAEENEQQADNLAEEDPT
ncbi:MAG: effector-associated domain EAD1-containing protein [Chloroflexota bacterium]|nr:effector-associated domain EAD1-containing protein [Chloroflexota bacterium]